MSKPHPYKSLENTATWKALEKGIADLVDNGDLTESTSRSRIIGYLTKMVHEERASMLRGVRLKLQKDFKQTQRDALEELEKIA